LQHRESRWYNQILAPVQLQQQVRWLPSMLKRF
jgi:hypothetical protein